MFENRVAKSFTTRRNLLRGAFPAAHEFLCDLEERSPPVIWLDAQRDALVYWQDSCLCGITFVGVGEANTGIRFSPASGRLVEGTVDRSQLLFSGPLDALVERHGGLRNRWATRREHGEVELRHPAPAAFFRDFMGLLQTTGARDRAERLASVLEGELAADGGRKSGDAGRGTPAPGATRPSGQMQTSPATTAARAVAEARSDGGEPERTPSAVAASAVAATLAPPTSGPMSGAPSTQPSGAVDARAPAADAQHAEPSRAHSRPLPLRPSDTHRLIGLPHLVDAYLELAVCRNTDGERAAAARRRVERLERVFLCRLPRVEELRGPRSADRAQVVELAWRCLNLAAHLESPFLAPPSASRDAMILGMWDDHGEALGTPIEAVRRACLDTVRGALMRLFPGVEETIVSEAELPE